MKEAVKRQRELNELCRRNTAQAQMRQRKKYDEKNTGSETICSGQIRLGLPECYTYQRDKENTYEMERTVHDKGSTPARTVLPLE